MLHRSGAYALSAFLSQSVTDGTLVITKRTHIATDNIYRHPVNPSGITIEWNNPLVSTQTMARRIALLLLSYYKNGILTFDVPYRGNPEIECGDHICYTTETGLHPPMIVEDNDLQFNGAFRGHISGRKAVT